MTSSEGLLSLVNQLQNMETAMGLFLIETALKLSTFHDTKFFVMVDLPEGRKIAGKGEMIQRFLDGKLLPSSSDVKIELVPEVSALMEYPLREVVGAASAGMGSADNLKQEPRPFRPYSQSTGFRQPSAFDTNSPSAMSLQHRPSSSFDASSRLMGIKSPKMATSAGGPLSPQQQQQQHQQPTQPLQHHHSITPTAESPYGCGSAPMSPMPLQLQHHHGQQQQPQQRKRPSSYDQIPQQQSQQQSSTSSSPKAMKIEGREDEEASVMGDEDEEENLQVIYPDEHSSGGGGAGGSGGGDDYPIPAPVAHMGGVGSSKYSPFHPYQSYHQADLNSEDQTNRIAMAQQFSYEEVKAKDSTGFKIIASIVYAKAKELAADCPIADYKGPEVNNYLRQEYLAWFARTFPRLYDTKATALFRARMQICFQTIRKKLFPPPPQHSASMGVGGGGGNGGGGGGPSSSLLSVMGPDMSSGNMGGTGYPDRNFGVQSLVTRRDDNHHGMAAHSAGGQDRGGGGGDHQQRQLQQQSPQIPTQQQHQHQQQQHQQPQQQQQPQQHQQPQQQPPTHHHPHHHHHHHHDEAINQVNPEREESRESASLDVKCHDLNDAGGGGAEGGGGGGNSGGDRGAPLQQPDMNNSSLGSMGMNSFIDVAGDRNPADPYPFGQC